VVSVVCRFLVGMDWCFVWEGVANCEFVYLFPSSGINSCKNHIQQKLRAAIAALDNNATTVAT
jgi:hypothetical protein